MLAAGEATRKPGLARRRPRGLHHPVAARSARALWTAALRGGSLPRPGRPADARAPAANRGFRGVILGIDPSLRGTGLAVVDLSGPSPRLLASATLRMPPSQSAHACLARIHREVLDLGRTHRVGAVALESTVYVQNLRTVAILGASRGAALAAAGELAAIVAEYAPARVKQAVAGNGRASKAQVIRMVASVLGLREELAHDEADAAAVALCHGWTARA